MKYNKIILKGTASFYLYKAPKWGLKEHTFNSRTQEAEEYLCEFKA